LKVQQRWRGQYEQLAKNVAEEEATFERLTRGSIADSELGEPALRGEVRRLTLDRGRVWRNLRLAEVGDGQVTLDATRWGDAGCGTVGSPAEEEATDEEAADADAAPAEGAAPPAQAPASLGVEANAVVYAFKEAPLGSLPEGLRSVLLAGSDLAENEAYALCRVPVFYLGEFRVAGDPNAAPGTLTLQPSMPLSDSQIQQLQDAESTWVLYEIMPVDSHTIYEGFSIEQLAPMFASETLDPAVVQALAQEYARDQQSADANDPPERKWMRVEFTQAHSEDVDVDVPAEAGEQPLADTLFDPSGRSQVATLSQGGKTEFQPGDQAVFDFATAEQLKAEGKVKEVETIYNRRLRDYAQIFRSFAAEMAGLAREMELAQADLDKLNESMTQLQAQIAFQTQQQQNLDFDRQGLQAELQVLSQHRGAVEAKWNELRGELSRLYRTNRQLVNRMTTAG
jgi:hypothetical protein